MVYGGISLPFYGGFGLKNVWKSESFYIYMRKEVESLNLDYRFNNLSWLLVLVFLYFFFYFKRLWELGGFWVVAGYNHETKMKIKKWKWSREWIFV